MSSSVPPFLLFSSFLCGSVCGLQLKGKNQIEQEKRRNGGELQRVKSSHVCVFCNGSSCLSPFLRSSCSVLSCVAAFLLRQWRCAKIIELTDGLGFGPQPDAAWLGEGAVVMFDDFFAVEKNR